MQAAVSLAAPLVPPSQFWVANADKAWRGNRRHSQFSSVVDASIVGLRHTRGDQPVDIQLALDLAQLPHCIN
jgi:hypothetical protein